MVDRVETPVPPVRSIADPAPLGLAAFALTTFLLSLVNTGWDTGGLIWIGPAFFYGGLAQLLAGMWEFRNGNTFGATAFSTYGGFWLSLGFFTLFLGRQDTNATNDLAWFVLAFAIFNTYMLAWAARVSIAVFAVFLTLEITEILLFIGLFVKPGTGFSLVNLAGLVGIVTALTAWYASAAGVANSLSRRAILPVGTAPWRDRAV